MRCLAPLLTLPLVASAFACSSTIDLGGDGGSSGDGAADDDSAPEPVPNPYVGRNYLLDLGDTTLLEPEGAEVLVAYLEGQYVLVSVTGGVDDTIDMMATLPVVDGKSVVQDPCVPVVSLEGGTYAPQDRSFTVGPVDFGVAVDPGIGVELEMMLRAFHVSGAFNASGSSIDDVTVLATLDMRDYADLFELLGVSDGCDVLVMYAGIECTACPSDGEPSCVGLHMSAPYMDAFGGAFDPSPEEPPEGC